MGFRNGPIAKEAVVTSDLDVPCRFPTDCSGDVSISQNGPLLLQGNPGVGQGGWPSVCVSAYRGITKTTTAVVSRKSRKSSQYEMFSLRETWAPVLEGRPLCHRLNRAWGD